jgi:integrase
MMLSLHLQGLWKGYTGKEFDRNFIFIQMETGMPMDVGTPTHKFKEILKMYNETHGSENQLPEITLHELRHTSATLLLANGTDIETVSHRLGHSKASTTLDIYGHAMKKMDSKASDTLESILSNRKKA